MILFYYIIVVVDLLHVTYLKIVHDKKSWLFEISKNILKNSLRIGLGYKCIIDIIQNNIT